MHGHEAIHKRYRLQHDWSNGKDSYVLLTNRRMYVMAINPHKFLVVYGDKTIKICNNLTTALLKGINHNKGLKEVIRETKIPNS